MKSQPSITSLLTAIVILLTLNLITMWSSNSAPSLLPDAQAAGIPNPGAQRVEMIRELKAVNKKLDDLTKLFTTGKAKVTVTE